MKNISFFFAPDRVYAAAVAKNEKGYELTDVHATENPIDLEDLDSAESQKGLEDLQNFFESVGKEFSRIAATLSPEHVLVSQFPGSAGMKASDVRSLVDLEMRQSYPRFDAKDFSVMCTPLSPSKAERKMMLATIVEKKIFSNVKKVLEPLGSLVDNIEISQLNAQDALLFNYPERAGETIASIGLDDRFIDIGTLEKGEPAYYNLMSFSDPSEVPLMIEEEVNKLHESYVEQIKAIYFYGSGLTKDVLMQVWETAMLLGLEATKLNAFRMLTASVGKREREYCSRTAHIFPPCVGGCFPPYRQRVKIY